MTACDVLVVGAGNAAFCATHAAREQGASVIMLEKAPRKEAGGNSFFTAGAFRVAYRDMATLRLLLDGLTDDEAGRIDLPPYTEEDFVADMVETTDGRTDRGLATTLAADSFPTALWLKALGVRWQLMYARQSFPVGERVQFFGGLAPGIVDGGRGLMEGHLAAARRAGVQVLYSRAATQLLRDAGGAVRGVVATGPDGDEEIAARAVVLACGGFEASPDKRRKHLGPSWELARVRGTPANTGDGIEMALAIGAQRWGDWGGCHAVFWDAGAPPTGDWELTNQLSKLGYPLGIVVNREGQRFVDEGADFRNYTYARYGRELLRQPGAVAYQIFDQQTLPLLRPDEYQIPSATRVEAETIAGLARALGLDASSLGATVASFNAAARPGPFNPAVKDGKGTAGIAPPKSNWAVPLEQPPFVAFPVTVGITFTFGGLRIDTEAHVLDVDSQPIPGLFAAGELVGGLFYNNYPGGSGLTAGAVFGRRAGDGAGRHARERSL